ncbi:hypothetical protein ACFCWY_08765 [Streptomyces sp. NPDC056362]|uniref:hypothetical protein n=1 Tax=unclassified Streptomyces TaxID=2593676 RepID=UPI0035DF815C
MPMLTQLPPNLTRNYYEVRGEDLAQKGVTVTPWYRLTEWERQAVNTEVDGFRRAVRRAEEEQALVAEHDRVIAAAAAPGIDYSTVESVTADETPADDACCPLCVLLSAEWNADEERLAAEQAADEETCENAPCHWCQIRGVLETMLRRSAARPAGDPLRWFHEMMIEGEAEDGDGTWTLDISLSPTWVSGAITEEDVTGQVRETLRRELLRIAATRAR